MEGDNMDMGSPSPTLASSRWNPTKEQINMLESLYRQGIRTPSAEQIQQITGRLRVYGHIEGKNVFYWFQNHKARQRQKQKQERMAFMNRYVHKTQPVFPPCSNVVCSPYYLPRSDLGLYPQRIKLPLPGGSNRRAKVDDRMDKARTIHGGSGSYDSEQQHEYNIIMMQSNTINEFCGVDKINQIDQETLPLFPLHPTGILKGRTSTNMPRIGSTSAENDSTTPSTSSETNNGIEQEASGAQPFFDFFSGRGCERD